MLGAYVFYDLRTSGSLLLPPIPFLPHTIGLGGPWSTVPAFVVSLLVCAVTGTVFDAIVLGRLRGGSPLAKLLASLGLLLTLQAFVLVRFGSTGQTAPAVFSESPGSSVHVFGQSVPDDRFILTGIVLALAAILWAAYRYTTFGIATRAAAEHETKAMLAGLSPAKLSRINTTLGFVIAGGVGILVAPISQLDPNTIALAVIPALAAALFARFTSFSVVTVAGLAMGAIGSIITYLSSLSWFPTSGGSAMPGVTQVVYFLIIIVALVWRGDRLPARGVSVEPSLPPAPEARRIVAPGAALGMLAIGALLVLPYDFRQALTNSAIGVILCLSFVVIVGFVGQISILQLGLAGVAGVIISKLALHAGIGFPVGLIAAVGGAVALGTAGAIPALRVRGVTLAIVTLSAAWGLQEFVFANPTIGGGVTAAVVPSPHLFGLDLGPNGAFPINASSPPSPTFGAICVIAAMIVGMLVAGLRRSRTGTRMLAVRSNERAAAAAGIDVRREKLIAFAIASGIAGLAGGLYAYDFGSVSGTNFGVLPALGFLAFAYLGGITTVSGAVIGGLLVTQGIGFMALNKAFGVPLSYQLLVGGIALIVTIMMNPVGVAGAASEAFRDIRRGRGRPRANGPDTAVVSPGAAPTATSTPPTTTTKTTVGS